MKHIWILIFFSACATTDLETRALNCKPVHSAECDRLHTLLEKKLEREKKFKCPSGYIVVKDDWGDQSCITQGDFRDWLKRLQRGW